MTDVRTVEVKPHFGGFVLETLTVGMYGESRNAIREYVQNAFDSIQRAIYDLELMQPGEGLITVTFGDDQLTVRDNGAGLSADIAAGTLTSIGASRKDYTSDAGFRGIGRLAGITFSKAVVFTTKAAGEAEQTEVTFDAAKMRELMAPGRGNEVTAEGLLTQCVSILIRTVEASLPSFFQVTLSGFTEAPEEVLEPKTLQHFLSQVAPVPYDPAFKFGAEIRAQARASGFPIEEVALQIKPADGATITVYKAYTDTYQVGENEEFAPMIGIELFQESQWWCWLGKKELSGSYVDPNVRGVRVRAKNIQIDGTDVVREIFQKHAKSNARYQDWAVGEIFVDLKAVTPNARRDGFEDTAAWRKIRGEISKTVCAEIGRAAQAASADAQLTVEKLSDKAEKLLKQMGTLRRVEFRDSDRTLTFSADVTKLQGEVARASRNADPATQAALQHVASQLTDVKAEAVAKIAPQSAKVDREAIEHEARRDLLDELMTSLEDRLEAPCLAAVRKVVRTEYGWPS